MWREAWLDDDNVGPDCEPSGNQAYGQKMNPRVTHGLDQVLSTQATNFSPFDGICIQAEIPLHVA